MNTSAPDNAERQWFIAGRWQEYEGEARANLLRVTGIALFYVIELLNRPQVTQAFHEAATYVAAAWVLTGCTVYVSLRRRFFPEAMKFLSTGVDLVLFTCLLLLADGPRSPLIVGYFVILSLSALRFNLPLVRFATFGAIGSYLVVFKQAEWMRPSMAVSRNYELIVLVSLALCGTTLGQAVRRIRGFAEDYANRRAEGQ